MLSKQIEEVLTKDGGWMSAGAILNRCEDGATSAKVRNALDELLAMNLVQQIHGISGLEYALAGVKLPAGYKPPPPVMQGKASDVEFDPTQKASGPRVLSAPSLTGASRKATPIAPTPATASGGHKPASTRDRVLDELRMAGARGADTVQLMNRTGCAIGNVYNALSDLRSEGLARTEKIGNSSRHYFAQNVQGQTPAAPAVTADRSTTNLIATPVTVAAPASSAATKAATTPKHPHGYTRDQIRDLLVAEPALKAKEVAERLKLSPATVAYHFKNIINPAPTAVRARVEPLAAAAAEGIAPIPRDPVVAVDTPTLNEQIKELFEKGDAARAEIVAPTRFALWSTGELVIKRTDGITVTLDAADTRALLHYLDGVAQIGLSA